VFDDQDAAFVSCLMSTNGPPQQPVEEADADAAPELPPAQSTVPQDS
jgi:hypothetical protein